MEANTKSSPVDTPSMEGGAARRRTPRRAYRRPVGVLVGGHYEVLEGRSLSEGGVSVLLGDAGRTAPKLSLEELRSGARIAISIILPAGPVLVLRGEVVYREGDAKLGHSIGIKFDVVPLHQRREIRNYVSSKQVGEVDLN